MKEYEIEEPTIDNALIQTQILMMSRKIVDYVSEQGCEIHIQKVVRINDIFDPEEVKFFASFSDEILSEFSHHMAALNYFADDIMCEGGWYDEDDHCIHLDLFYGMSEKEKRKYKRFDSIASVFCIPALISLFVFLFDLMAIICMGFAVSQTVKLLCIISLGLFLLSASTMEIFAIQMENITKSWEPEIKKHFAATGVENTEEK